MADDAIKALLEFGEAHGYPDLDVIEELQRARTMNEAVGRLLCRRYACNFCWELRNHALKSLDHGPEAVIRAFADYDGMLCGSAEWAKFFAMEVLRDEAESAAD